MASTERVPTTQRHCKVINQVDTLSNFSILNIYEFINQHKINFFLSYSI